MVNKGKNTFKWRRKKCKIYSNADFLIRNSISWRKAFILSQLTVVEIDFFLLLLYRCGRARVLQPSVGGVGFFCVCVFLLRSVLCEWEANFFEYFCHQIDSRKRASANQTVTRNTQVEPNQNEMKTKHKVHSNCLPSASIARSALEPFHTRSWEP